ncbi:hypothetical protein V8C37DRAFT_402301 [Trichoderma ceciliae]
MARPEKRQRRRSEDLLADQIPSKKPKASAVCPRPWRKQNRKRRADNPPHDQVPTTNANPSGVFPGPSRLQNCKKRADDSPQDQIPSSKSKSSGVVHRPSNFPPEFYDNLSKVWLTPRALQELNWRNESLSLPKRTVDRISTEDFTEDLVLAARKGGPDLARFARTGGPDLSDLQGFPTPTSITHAMASQSSSSTSSRQTQSTKPTTVSSKGKRSSAYDVNFEQHCIDHNIYPPFYKFTDGRRPPKPLNFEEIRRALKVPRGSLSPSIVPKTAFEDFQDKNTTKSEGTLMRSVVPALAGDLDIPNDGHLPFANLESMAENTTAIPVPDFFDGVLPGAVDKQVREDLNRIIVPTKHSNVPIATNLFLEVKGPAGTGDVAKGQAIQNGAIGTRLMWFLQNYGEEDPIYDGNAYTFSATLVDGQLKLYAHHLAAPPIPEQPPDYYATQLKAYALTGDDEVWLEGTGAFRNMRILAQGYRDQFIKNANARAWKQKVEAAATVDDLASTIEEQPGSSPLDFYDCQVFAEPEEDDQETQETNAGLAILHHGYGKDDADNTEVSTDFAASFTSSFTSVSREDHLRSQRQPKLPRSPPSPSSSRQVKKRGPA